MDYRPGLLCYNQCTWSNGKITKHGNFSRLWPRKADPHSTIFHTEESRILCIDLLVWFMIKKLHELWVVKDNCRMRIKPNVYRGSTTQLLIVMYGLLLTTPNCICWEIHQCCTVREGVQIKKTFLNGHCPFRGGGPQPLPGCFGPFFY